LKRAERLSGGVPDRDDGRMKVRLPLMVQDPLTTRYPGVMKVVEGMHLTLPEGAAIGDGPSTDDLVVVDRDSDTGVVTPPARFEPPDKRRKMGRFAVPDDIYAAEFIQVAAFAAVAKTLRTLAPSDVLGYPVGWRDSSRPLTIVPRAGEWANALYDRSAQALELYYFPDPRDSQRRVYTALARDVVAHECAHALVDALAPWLYDSANPESRAIHETVADLAALMTSFRSGTLVPAVLEHTRGSIHDSTAFSSLATELGSALAHEGHRAPLRDMWNERTLASSGADPHALAEVLGGALYRVIAEMYESEWRRHGGDFSRSGYWLARSAAAFTRLLLRAVALLPPGDASLADFCRCMVVAGARESDSPLYESFVGAWDREPFLGGELVRRGVLADRSELHVPAVPPGSPLQLAQGDVGRVFADDGRAYVDAHRAGLGIPPDVPIELLPCSSAYIYFEEEGQPTHIEELLVKVAWTSGPVRCGRTIVIDSRREQVIAVVAAGQA
jgi:hypothetical protein